jgi:hypothetical protein
MQPALRFHGATAGSQYLCQDPARLEPNKGDVAAFALEPNKGDVAAFVLPAATGR